MKLFIPGPVNVEIDVLHAQTKDMIGHRSKEFRELMKNCSLGLKELLYTKNRVLISTSSGSGLMEGAIRNLVNEKVLVCVNGDFGKKWEKIAISCGKKVTILESEYGKAINKEELISELDKNDYEAVCITLNETSTGIENNLEELVPIIKKKNLLVLVDAVSCMGGKKIEADKLELDVCIASSQKCFALPPGLSFVMVSEEALEKAKTVSNRGYYFDFVELAKEYDANQTPYTPAISLIFSLEEQLKKMKEEGFENRFKRHQELKQLVHDWVEENGFELFADKEYASSTVTCIKNNKNIDFSKVKEMMREKKYVIDTGYKKLNERLITDCKSQTFRIAHMGETTKEEMINFLNELKITIGEMNESINIR